MLATKLRASDDGAACSRALRVLSGSEKRDISGAKLALMMFHLKKNMKVNT